MLNLLGSLFVMAGLISVAILVAAIVGDDDDPTLSSRDERVPSRKESHAGAVKEAVGTDSDR